MKFKFPMFERRVGKKSGVIIVREAPFYVGYSPMDHFSYMTYLKLCAMARKHQRTASDELSHIIRKNTPNPEPYPIERVESERSWAQPYSVWDIKLSFEDSVRVDSIAFVDAYGPGQDPTVIPEKTHADPEASLMHVIETEFHHADLDWFDTWQEIGKE